MNYLLSFLGLLSLSFMVHAQPLELVLWHAMAGQLANEVQLLADDFNNTQQQYRVKPVYKGNYTETLTSFAAAFRAQQPPAMVQVFEVGTAMMLAPKGVIKPVAQLMSEQNMALPQADFTHSVNQFYSRDGRLMAMPFNISAPVLYYNKTILAKVGYGDDQMPTTWDELEVLAEKLKTAGFNCTYTTAYPGWILLESYVALHGLATVDPDSKQIKLNTPQLINYLTRLKRWQQAGFFRYGGREDDATILFTSSICPLFTQSSGAYNSLVSMAPFPLGVAALPLDTSATKTRHANVAGGAALWAVSGQTQEQYQGIAQFFAFIARAKTQQKWHEHTGYLPIGFKGEYATLSQASTHPALTLARTDLEDKAPLNLLTHNGPQNQIRVINDEVLEALFAGLVTPEQALIDASKRANHVVLRFKRNTQR